MNYSLALHGGAGPLQPEKMDAEKQEKFTNALNKAYEAGEAEMKKDGSALDVAEATVKALEDEPQFNAGRGAVLDNTGKIENEATIMDGELLEAGGCTAITQTRNPISLARKIMEHSPHVLLYGEGAEAFGREHELESKEVSWFYTDKRIRQWEESKGNRTPDMDHSTEKGTVGCVVRDPDGNLASATSTGGMNRKWRGRIGDTAMIGPGTYANNKTCAISCTGKGDFFIRGVIAYDVHAQMLYVNLPLEEACTNALKNLQKLGGEGGLIGVDYNGNIVTPFISKGMFRLTRTPNGEVEVAIF